MAMPELEQFRGQALTLNRPVEHRVHELVELFLTQVVQLLVVRGMKISSCQIREQARQS